MCFLQKELYVIRGIKMVVTNCFLFKISYFVFLRFRNHKVSYNYNIEKIFIQ